MATTRRNHWLLAGLCVLFGVEAKASTDSVPLDLQSYRKDCGVLVESSVVDAARKLSVRWPVEQGDWGHLEISLEPERPLVNSLSLVIPDPKGNDLRVALAKEVDPAFWITVGTRESPADRPVDMSVFNVFFDSPAKRPYKNHRSRFHLERARVTSQPGRATIHLERIEAGPFSGSLEITVYAQSRLLHIAAVMKTDLERCAYLYDAGLVAEIPPWRAVSWVDTEGKLQRQELTRDFNDRALAVRHRSIVAESAEGTLTCFPPPHQYFFPRDLTDNQSNVWFGRQHREHEERWGLGIRQTETGGGSYVPWFNAPVGTDQRMGVFLLLSRGGPREALKETLRYTHEDRFPELPGMLALTSHWHMEIAMAALREIAKGKGRTIPDFVAMFKEMGIKVVHLAEFHGEGHPQDPGPLRLAELDAMFQECRRLSAPDILFLPGEEANVYLGAGPGKHPGHWLYLFPKPVYWTMRRVPQEPFAEDRPGLGKVYHVGNSADMVRLLEEEKGLAWTAHPRIKASNWAPDEYRAEPFYLAPNWLGATWKAMPADLSRTKLGERGLDLLDDMANWGGRKYLLGEVDVFKIDHRHELYGHMNVNYVRLPRLPRFDEDWSPLLDALRLGRFFVTTGEVLIHDFQVGGRSSGESLATSGQNQQELVLDMEWTFPLQNLEIITGDGTRIHRQRISMEHTGPFGRQRLTHPLDLRQCRWVRVEVWDVAANGAFTQPVWLSEDGSHLK